MIKKKMICHYYLDTAEVSENDVPDEAPTPAQDECTSKAWCEKTINDKSKLWGRVKHLQVGSVEQQLHPSVSDANDHGFEHAWWLKKCCAKTAKFTEAVK